MISSTVLLAVTVLPLFANVDFRKDVQPLIRQHCFACHGPEQQMNAFRLDRRSAAMRGGTRSVIVPGSSMTSRLYLRLIGDQFGRRMPATGTLTPDEIAVFKAWIDQGAVWPDDLANETVLTPPDPKAVRLTSLLRSGDLAEFRKMADADAKSLNARGPEGATPFMYSVLYADASTVKAVLAKGGDPNKRNDANATPLMWAVNDLAKTQALVEARADVNAVSTDGRTPLIIAATQAGTAAVIRFLIEHGADVNPKGHDQGDASPLREAATAGDPEVMKLLLDHGASVKKAGSGALAGALEVKCTQCVDLIGKQLNASDNTKAFVGCRCIQRSGRDPLRTGSRCRCERGTDADGRTAIMYAANSDRLPVETVRPLIARGLPT